MRIRAVRWSCARCEVSVGRIDGQSSRLPSAWSRSHGLTYCLSCSRARAAEAAMDSVPESTSRKDRLRLGRKALIAFEIERTPAAADRAIAGACRTTSQAVAAVRNEMTASSPTTDRTAPHAA